MTDSRRMVQALNAAGVPDAALADPATAHLLVEAHHPLSLQEVPGIHIRLKRRPWGIAARIEVEDEAWIARPVHLCFGMFRQIGVQHVKLDMNIGARADVRFLAHCLFSRARNASHRMDARIRVGEHARLAIEESHFHGPYGGIRVLPRARIQLAPHAAFYSDFSLIHGRVGRLKTDYTVDVDDHGLVELSARVCGRDTDRIELRDRIRLNGEGARGMVKTRVALRNQAVAEVTGEAEGNAAHTRGHMDCTEIVQDQARGRSMPMVGVSHPLAKITHEAAIGTVDQSQLETLMAHGLSPDEAVELVIGGLLRPGRRGGPGSAEMPPAAQ